MSDEERSKNIMDCYKTQTLVTSLFLTCMEAGTAGFVALRFLLSAFSVRRASDASRAISS